MKIIVIEDESLIQKSIALFLRKKGHDVICFSTGMEALAEIKKVQFDKIICDIMLKDITGYEIFEESKKWIDPGRLSKLFIFITAYSNNQIVSHLRTIGCKILNKPFPSLSALLELIEEHDDRG